MGVGTAPPVAAAGAAAEGGTAPPSPPPLAVLVHCHHGLSAALFKAPAGGLQDHIFFLCQLSPGQEGTKDPPVLRSRLPRDTKWTRCSCKSPPGIRVGRDTSRERDPHFLSGSGLCVCAAKEPGKFEERR